MHRIADILRWKLKLGPQETPELPLFGNETDLYWAWIGRGMGGKGMTGW
jgi:hypothetical protein